MKKEKKLHSHFCFVFLSSIEAIMSAIKMTGSFGWEVVAESKGRWKWKEYLPQWMQRVGGWEWIVVVELGVTFSS